MARGAMAFSQGLLPAAASGQVDVLASTIRALLAGYLSNGRQAWREIEVVNGSPSTYDSVFQSVGDRSIGLIAVDSITPGSPTAITTPAAHDLVTGDLVNIYGAVGTGIDAVNADGLAVTVTGPSAFTVAVDTTSGSYASGGSIESLYTGDTALYLRVQRVSNDIGIYAYSDWSPVSGTGSRLSSSVTQVTNPSDVGEYLYFCVMNEYEFVLIGTDSAYPWFSAVALSPIRIAGPKTRGVTRLRAATAGTGTVVLAVRSDVSASLTVGQKVWLINQTVPGQALAADYQEVVTVDAVTSSSITVSGVVNTPYQRGSLVGLDPAPFAVGVNANAVPVLYGCSGDDSTHGGLNSRVLNIRHAGELLAAADNNPSGSGDYIAVPALLRGSAAATGGLRGYVQSLVAVAIGTQANGDRHLVDRDTASAYKVFPSVPLTSGWAAMIGPGAPAAAP